MKKSNFFLFFLILLLTFSINAENYSISEEISGSPPVENNAPWAYVSIYSVDSNTVHMELNALDLPTDSYVRYWYFNFAEGFDLNSLNFQLIGGNANTQVSISKGENSFNVPQGGKYDIYMNFPEASQQRFSSEESVVIEVTSVNPINASMFNQLSNTNNPNHEYYTAAQIWNNSNKKGWIGTQSTVSVPEPSTYLILLSFLGLIYCLNWKKTALLRKSKR